MSVTLHVCITCRAGEPVPEGQMTPGAKLYEALTVNGPTPDVEIVAVECLSACSQGCAIALSGVGRWSYVYGRLSAQHAQDILAGTAAYANSSDGVVPWRTRPEIFRKQSLARIPPIKISDRKEAAE